MAMMEEFWQDGYRSYKEGVEVAAPALSPFVMEKLKNRSVGDPFVTSAMKTWIEGWNAAAGVDDPFEREEESDSLAEPDFEDDDCTRPEQDPSAEEVERKKFEEMQRKFAEEYTPPGPDDVVYTKEEQQSPDFHPIDPSELRSWSELQSSGLLWLINTTVFHPRGYALALITAQNDETPVGWTLVGDGTSPWMFGHPPDAEFASVQRLLSPKEETSA